MTSSDLDNHNPFVFLCKLWLVHTSDANGSANTSSRKYRVDNFKANSNAKGTDAKSLAHALHLSLPLPLTGGNRDKANALKKAEMRVSPCSCFCVERVCTGFALCMCFNLRRFCKPAFRAFNLIAMVGYLD